MRAARDPGRPQADATDDRTQLPEETDVGASILDLAVRQLRGSPCLGRLDENHRMCPQLCDFTETALGYPGYCICSKGRMSVSPRGAPTTSQFHGADATLLDEASPLVVVNSRANGVPLDDADLRAAAVLLCPLRGLTVRAAAHPPRHRRFRRDITMHSAPRRRSGWP